LSEITESSTFSTSKFLEGLAIQHFRDLLENALTNNSEAAVKRMQSALERLGDTFDFGAAVALRGNRFYVSILADRYGVCAANMPEVRKLLTTLFSAVFSSLTGDSNALGKRRVVMLTMWVEDSRDMLEWQANTES